MLGETVARLQVEIGANLKGLNKSLKGAEGSLKQFGRRMDSIGRTMTKSVTLPLLAIGTAAVKVASDAAEMRSKFDVVFPKHGGSIIDRLTEFAAATNQSKSELIGLSAGLGDIFKPLGFAESAAADLSAQMVELGVDLASFNNIPLDEALQRLQGTLVGSHENALKFGVVINENVLKQELARIGADKLTGAQKEQAKVQARLNLLLAGTTDAQGDATRTSGSFANQVKGLKNNLKELGIEVGTKLLPLMTRLVGKLKGGVEWFGKLSGTQQEIITWAAVTLAALGPVAVMLASMAASVAVLSSPIVIGAAIGAGVYALAKKVEGAVGAGALKPVDIKPLTSRDVDRAMTRGIFAPVSAHTPAGAGGGGTGGGGGGGEVTERWAANIQKVEKAALASLHTFKGMAEPVQRLRQTSQVVSESWEMFSERLLEINARVRTLGTEMRLGMTDTIGDAIGQLATLQTGFGGFLNMVVQGLRQQLAATIALIAKQKILNALKAQESMFSSAGGLGGVLGALGLGAMNPLLGIGLAVGGLALASRLGGKNQQVQLGATRLPGGDIAISANSGHRRHARLRR